MPLDMNQLAPMDGAQGPVPPALAARVAAGRF